MWHFAAMWLLVINGLVYVTLGIVNGRFRRKLLPIYPAEVFADAKAVLTFKLAHDDLSLMEIRIPTKLGYKNPKYAVAMEVTNTDKGGYWENQGYNWFGGL